MCVCERENAISFPTFVLMFIDFCLGAFITNEQCVPVLPLSDDAVVEFLFL